MADGVRADVEAVALKDPQLPPGHPRSLAAVGESVGDDVGRRVLVVAPDDRGGVRDDVAVGVIERHEHRIVGKPPTVHERVPDLELRDGVTAV